MSADAGGGAWGYAGTREGGQLTYQWQERGASGASGVLRPSTHEPAMADAAPATSTGVTPTMRMTRRRRCTVVAVGVLGLLVVLVLLAFFAFGKDEVPNQNLLLVSVIFRHGDRSPTETYPNDPHPHSAWPEGLGALTNEGKMQMFTLGQWLRKRYGSFLGAEYHPERLRVQSSASDRCLMSAGALLAGLMPPTDAQRWHPDLDWQPVPVHYKARAQDTMIAAKKSCPVYDDELQKAYRSPEIQSLNEENKELYEYLTKHSGKTINNITDVEFLYNTLLIEKIHKMDLPDWTKTVFPDKMKPLAAKSLAIFTHNDFMKRVRGGPLLKEIADHMEKKASHPTKASEKMFLYSAHDLTIVNIWRALGFTQLLHVDYGAALILELRWIEQGVNLEVKILYLNNSLSTVPVDLKMPGCTEPCDRDTFLSLIQHILPTNWNKDCGILS